MLWGRNGSRIYITRIAWVWGMVFIGLVVYAMVWFMLGSMVMQVIDAVEAGYTFVGSAADVVTVIKTVIAFHPLLAMFGWLLWGYINSTRRDPRAYAEY